MASGAAARTTAHTLFRHAAQYAEHRPTYPASVFAAIRDAVSEPRHLVIDVGTGTGQALPGLLEHFGSVVGLEPSGPQQAKAADMAASLDPERVRVVHTGSEDLALERSGVDPGTACAVTAFQAAHWFELGGPDGFYSSAARVLRPGGVVALVGYGNCKVTAADGGGDAASAAEACLKLYEGVLGPFWDERRRLVDAHYRGMEPERSTVADWAVGGEGARADDAADAVSIAPVWERCWREDALSIERVMPLDAFLGYIATWSAYQTYSKDHPDAEALIAELSASLTEHLGRGELRVTWPVFMLFSRRAS